MFQSVQLDPQISYVQPQLVQSIDPAQSFTFVQPVQQVQPQYVMMAPQPEPVKGSNIEYTNKPIMESVGKGCAHKLYHPEGIALPHEDRARNIQVLDDGNDTVLVRVPEDNGESWERSYPGGNRVRHVVNDFYRDHIDPNLPETYRTNWQCGGRPINMEDKLRDIMLRKPEPQPVPQPEPQIAYMPVYVMPEQQQQPQPQPQPVPQQQYYIAQQPMFMSYGF